LTTSRKDVDSIKNTAGIANIPTIGFGPGEEEQAHTPNDHLAIDQLIKSAKGYSALALKLLKK